MGAAGAAGALRSYLRSTGGADGLGTLVLAGGFVFGVCSGLAILGGAALPRWLGWVAIVIGIATLVPPAAFAALLAFVIWSIVVSVLMYRRSGVSTSTPLAAKPQFA